MKLIVLQLTFPNPTDIGRAAKRNNLLYSCGTGILPVSSLDFEFVTDKCFVGGTGKMPIPQWRNQFSISSKHFSILDYLYSCGTGILPVSSLDFEFVTDKCFVGGTGKMPIPQWRNQFSISSKHFSILDYLYSCGTGILPVSSLDFEFVTDKCLVGGTGKMPIPQWRN